MMIKLLIVLFFVLIKTVHSQSLEEKINTIFSENLYPAGYFIYQLNSGNVDIVSLRVKPLDSNFLVEESFIFKDEILRAKVKGIPVKTTDQYIYFYDRYSFYRYSLKDGHIIKEKRLNTDFFKRIHKDRLIIIDRIKIYLKDKALVFSDGYKLDLDLPQYLYPTVLNFHYCDGDLLGIFSLRDGRTIYHLIDISRKEITKSITFLKDQMVGFYACLNDKILIYKDGLKLMDWNKNIYKLPFYVFEPERKIIIKTASISILENEILDYRSFYKDYLLLRAEKNITKDFDFDGFMLKDEPYSQVHFRIFDYYGNKLWNFTIYGYLQYFDFYKDIFFFTLKELSGIKKDGLLWEECLYQYSLKDKNFLEKMCYQVQPEHSFKEFLFSKSQDIKIFPTVYKNRFFLIAYPGKYCVKRNYQGDCLKTKWIKGAIYLLDKQKNIYWRYILSKKAKVLHVDYEKVVFKDKDTLMLVDLKGKIEIVYRFKNKDFDVYSMKNPVHIKDGKRVLLFFVYSNKLLYLGENCKVYLNVSICLDKEGKIHKISSNFEPVVYDLQDKNIKGTVIGASKDYIYFITDIYPEYTFVPVFSIKHNKLVDNIVFVNQNKNRNLEFKYGKILEILNKRVINVFQKKINQD